MKTQIHARVLCGTILAFVFSATCWAAYEDYVQHVSSDGTTTPSFSDNAWGKWQTNGVAEAEWPCAGMKFYVPGPGMGSSIHVLYTSNLTISAGNSMTLTFPGDELVLGGRLQPLLKRSSYGAANAFLRVPALTLLPSGGIYYANAQAAGVEGACTITGTSSQPSYWYVNVVGGYVCAYCNLDFEGESSAVFRFRDEGKNKSDNLTQFCYGGDMSKFYGTIRVQDPFASLKDNTPTGLNLPGTLALSGGAIFNVPAGKTSTIANLSDSGGILLISGANGSHGNLVVTNSFSGTPPYRFEAALSPEAEEINIITLADGATGTLSPDDFVWTNRFTDTDVLPSVIASSPEAFLINVSNSIKTVNGAQTISAVHRKFVWQDITDGGEDKSFMLPECKSHWNDDSEISPENDYFIGCGYTAHVPTGSSTFTGGSLTICGVGSCYIRNGNKITVPDFRWVPNATESSSQIQTYNGSSAVFGKVTVVDVPGKVFGIKMWNGGDSKHAFTLAAELAGGGTLDLASLSSASADTRAFYVVSGLNTNFTGRLRLRHDPFSGSNAAAYNAAPDTYCVTLTVTDPRNLGGARAAFAQDALVIANHSLMKIIGSLTFDEPTRGWSIIDVGRINVESGETVSITNKQITYAGEFRKEGAGTLKLGGTARFTADALATPLEGTNVLAIAGGAFMPTDATCCDGLAVKFAAGTKLLLDAAAEGDLKAYGLYDVKWDSPIDVADGAALPVELVLPEGFDTQTCHRFGICTVSPTAAASMSVDDFAVARVKRMRAKVSRVENLDASDNVVSVTFACNLVPAGFTMTIR